MLYLIQKTSPKIDFFNLPRLKKSFICFFIIISFLIIPTQSGLNAAIQEQDYEGGKQFARSLESLRDLDNKTWQIVVYSPDEDHQRLIVRIVGFPGSLRFDHPQSLKVNAGLHSWALKDLTLMNPLLANDSRDAAAEFELSPVLNQLTNNRPLRLELGDVFTDLPVPPYLVAEWRSLMKSPEEIEK